VGWFFCSFVWWGGWVVCLFVYLSGGVGKAGERFRPRPPRSGDPCQRPPRSGGPRVGWCPREAGAMSPAPPPHQKHRSRGGSGRERTGSRTGGGELKCQKNNMPIPNTWNDVMLVMGLNDLVTQTRPVSLVGWRSGGLKAPPSFTSAHLADVRVARRLDYQIKFALRVGGPESGHQLVYSVNQTRHAQTRGAACGRHPRPTRRSNSTPRLCYASSSAKRGTQLAGCQ
jgi:hypothetical protein